MAYYVDESGELIAKHGGTTSKTGKGIQQELIDYILGLTRAGLPGHSKYGRPLRPGEKSFPPKTNYYNLVDGKSINISQMDSSELQAELERYKKQLNKIGLSELEGFAKEIGKVTPFGTDIDFPINLDKGIEGETVKSRASWESKWNPNTKKFELEDRSYKGGHLGLRREGLDVVETPEDKMGTTNVSMSRPGDKQSRTQYGPFGLGTERQLWKQNGKYFTTLSFIKKGGTDEQDYWFKGGEPKEIKESEYNRLQKKMRERRLKNISKAL